MKGKMCVGASAAGPDYEEMETVEARKVIVIVRGLCNDLVTIQHRY